MSVPPFSAVVVTLGDEPAVGGLADEVVSGLARAGVDTRHDDRDERAGVKFNDVDLIVNPLRITIRSRGVADRGVE